MGTFQSDRRPKRRGVVTVEFALTAPILFLFVFAGFEFSRASMIINTCENAAFEGARRGIVPGATSSACQQEANAILQILGVNQSTVTVTPTTIEPDSPTVTVQVNVPLNAANGYVIPRFFLGKTVSRTVTLQREVN